jgi:hypothetical protein
MNVENPANGFDHDDMNMVIRRLAALGWLEDQNIVTKDWINIRYSEKGFERMRKLNSLLKSFPEFFSVKKIETPNPVRFLQLAGGLKTIAPELFSPILSGREYQAFLELVAAPSVNDSDEFGGGFDNTQHPR